MRLVLDTNVIVAGMAYPAGPPGRIVAAWRRGSLDVVLSPWILNECARVLPRLHAFSQLSPDEVQQWVQTVSYMAEIIEPDLSRLAQAAEAGVRDVMDEPVLALLLASKAEVLVSGDKDLLALAGRFSILSPAAFCARYAP